ncbi:hypothetical protein PSTG_15037 [Puccinia striiformis f. sp. tritici PST-78]|uniref:GAF domain-containing protein n=1 Tax=Puccinia striiformis f. sp. tritici PST-78 TaxID=1165861 RepID=A0A0L0UWY2_9BASI|nr:hypothetical protein PSTG_15037 [Puccinia striiformis f. sp. tritici PST-78]
MSSTKLGSHGINLPYSSLFNANLRDQSTRPINSRPPDYFWKKATDPTTSDAVIPGDVTLRADNEWLDFDSSALSDSEDESNTKQKVALTRSRKLFRLSRLRRIAFKAFTTKSQDTSKRKNIVTSTEFVFQQGKADDSGQHRSDNSKGGHRMRIFESLRFKSRGSEQPHTKKMVAVLKHRISADSPHEELPKTWDEYCRLYASGQIDILRPPLPPPESYDGKSAPSAFRARFFAPPQPANESVRRLVINRLGLFGGKAYDPTEVGFAKWRARVEMGSKLMEEGKAPSSLEFPWETQDCTSMNEHGAANTYIESRISTDRFSSETLEQHPVLRKIVDRCRELFGAAISLLSIIEDGRLIIMAESGLDEAGCGGIRDAPVETTFCAHTILGGRKGFTVLDAHKDWRFENNPGVQSFGHYFYAGAPIMAPNLDGSQEAEQNSCTLGSLCVADYEPRESFSVEDRKKLVYMSEYARREIEKWFAKKMEHKMNKLTASEESWNHEVQRVVGPMSDRHPEASWDAPTSRKSLASSMHQSSFGKSGAMISTGLALATSPQSPAILRLKASSKSRPGLFTSRDAALDPTVQKVLDLATKLVGETLDLALVYLTAVLPPRHSNGPGRTMIISGHNIPTPVPVFDADLHLCALRDPEGGLLYQNPSDSHRVALQPKSLESRLGECRPNPYASAMIFAVGTEAYDNSGGFVLAGYTDDPKRVFGAEDASFMKKFAQELSSYTSKLRL